MTYKNQDLQNIFPEGFIEDIEKNEELLYADTDSSYKLTKLPFSKYDNNENTVQYTQSLARDFNVKYLDILNNLLREKININPEYNLMTFKSEVVAYRGFFKGKKFYSLAKIWDEGTFFPELKLKKTGGQILKADTSKITFEMLSEIYEVLVLKTSIRNTNQLYQLIFRDIKNKYSTKIQQALDNFSFPDFSIPKKWSLGETKTVPVPVKGAKLYNLLIQDILRPGDSFFIIHVKINPDLLLKKIDDGTNDFNNSTFTLNRADINHKLNLIAIPTDISKDHITKLENTFKELDISIDIDRVINFNIDMKIETFRCLFDTKIMFKSKGSL